MTENAVLYALSTLAQTCAALAALVGALGLYRVQSLRERPGGVLVEVAAARVRRAIKALVGFETWHLLLIGVSLAGFNYVPWLMVWPWMFWALWAVAVGTVAVTGYCVYAWTRG